MEPRQVEGFEQQLSELTEIERRLVAERLLASAVVVVVVSAVAGAAVVVVVVGA